MGQSRRQPSGISVHGHRLRNCGSERLVFTAKTLPSSAESVATLIFSDDGDTTTLTMTIACKSVADRDALLEMRVDAGTARTLDNLAEYLHEIA
jgi:uncharacterized protein YndB with AHSA1/START domain